MVLPADRRGTDTATARAPGGALVDPTPIEAHCTRVWRSLKYLGVEEQELPDACQEVFLVLHRRQQDFRGDSSFETWVYGICMGVARNVRRGRKREAARYVDVEVEETYETCVEQKLDLDRTRAMLCRALDGLTEEQREVFVLREIEELPMKKVARVLSCPLFTAYSRLRLARRRLRALLEEMGARP